MDKLVKKSVVFGLGFMILLYSLNGMYISTNEYKSLNDVYKFKNVPYNLELVNFGTSHGQKGIYYGENNTHAFNYALSSQIFYYDYALLTQYGDHLKNGCIVIIPVSYLSLYQNYSVSIPEQEPRYYGILDPKYLSFTYGEYVRYQIFPVLSSGPNIRYILNDKESYSQEWEFDTKGSNEQEIHHDIDTRTKYHFIDKTSGDLKPYNNQSEYYLEKMVGYCNQNDYIPVLVTTPVTDDYRNAVPMEVINEFYPLINNLSRKYNVTYLDYSYCTNISSNYSLYLDSDHLDLTGRKKFTKLLVSDLKEIGLLDESKDVLTY
ncbi:hypothetical protein HNP88_000174 [Methanococcus maripaludis]|uniref:Uncharacterized protein n=1 Tax=Methanococcus maripaludis TaxID=39152 RepID=A0A7J9NLV1_METMI|nr:hypothetical protein [Methanococcus maripaludis]MBA2845990.1 hypothetical protein [Methanococcus maripaludis]